MKKLFVSELADANSSGAMVTETISKNGRNSKSQISRRSSLKNGIILLLLAMFLPYTVSAQKAFISSEIKPYIEFIEKTNTSPVDYVMNLFEKYDVVVIGERSHMDMTQYDLINQIISDPRFIASVGHVFTEVGSYNIADELNAVLKGSYSHDDIFDKELAKVIFNSNYLPLWEKTNYTKLMKDVYLVNKNLPLEKKINVTPTDISFSWRQAKTMTGEEYNTTLHRFWNNTHKDLLMGNNAINELYKIFDGNSLRKKALIIYNTPHSCRYFENQGFPFFAYQIIADRFPGRVANVMLNWCEGDESGGGMPVFYLSNDGKLDAAFAASGYKSIGFDLATSPFGNFTYEVQRGFSAGEVKKKDVYHGFIYYKPIYEWSNTIGVPNLEKIDIKDELARRHEVFSNNRMAIDKDELFSYYTTIRTIPQELIMSKERFYELIKQYYRPLIN